jgi:hypothetical protein
MTSSRSSAEILADRLSVVLEIGEANAGHHRAQALSSGARIEVMAIEERIAAEGITPELDAELEKVYALDDAAQIKVTQYEARVQALDRRLAALDDELAASSG